MQATADGFHTAAADLQACLLGPIASGADVYGYHALPDGWVLRLGGIAPKVQRPAVALEIADGPDVGPTP